MIFGPPLTAACFTFRLRIFCPRPPDSKLPAAFLSQHHPKLARMASFCLAPKNSRRFYVFLVGMVVFMNQFLVFQNKKDKKKTQDSKDGKNPSLLFLVHVRWPKEKKGKFSSFGTRNPKMDLWHRMWNLLRSFDALRHIPSKQKIDSLKEKGYKLGPAQTLVHSGSWRFCTK